MGMLDRMELIDPRHLNEAMLEAELGPQDRLTIIAAITLKQRKRKREASSSMEDPNVIIHVSTRAPSIDERIVKTLKDKGVTAESERTWVRVVPEDMSLALVCPHGCLVDATMQEQHDAFHDQLEAVEGLAVETNSALNEVARKAYEAGLRKDRFGQPIHPDGRFPEKETPGGPIQP